MIYRPQFFDLQELVCKEVYFKHGEKAWMFLDEKIIITIDTIRRLINKPITINNWNDGGEFDQRGLRCNLCPIVKNKTFLGELYLSAHVLGCAVDFNVEGITPDDVALWIAFNKDKLPYNLRIEKDTDTWTHLDCYDTGMKLNFFNA
jgi:hypothetical protein